MSHQGMSLFTAYAIGAALGLSITLGVVAHVADRIGPAESGIRALVSFPSHPRASARPAADPCVPAVAARLALPAWRVGG